MDKMNKNVMIRTCIATMGITLLGTAGVAQAHLVSFGWEDNLDGTVIMWGQHWHGDQTGPSTANGGVRIGDIDTDASTWPVFQWTGHVNNMGGTTDDNDALVASGVLTGWQPHSPNWSNSSYENDWFYTDPMVLGDGDWGLFTGTNCCIDTMSFPGEFSISGISSVPPGTAPNTAPPSVSVPEPSTLALLGFGVLGLAAARRRKLAQ